jgi:lipase ATG15
MFSCCCAAVDRTWKPICACPTGGSSCSSSCLASNTNFANSYYNLAQTIFVAIRSVYPSSISIWMTGHSLGGSLASLIGLTNNVPVITFEAPGDLLFASRIGLLPHLPPPKDGDTTPPDYSDFLASLPIYHFGNSGDPIFLGSCTGTTSSCYWGGYAMESKCHVGKVCTYNLDSQLPLTFQSSSPPVNASATDIRNHGIIKVIDVVKNMPVPDCQVQTHCVDCPEWTFS